MIMRVLEQGTIIIQVLKGDRKAKHLVSTWQDVNIKESIRFLQMHCQVSM